MTTVVKTPEIRMSRPVEDLLDAFHARMPIRTGSLVVTIFGDAVVPRGGVLSLASLLRITRAFRIGDGLVRTAMSRLVSEGWFERSKQGRNTFYRLTKTGQSTFANATDKIYRAGGHTWSGSFDAVLFDGDDREGFRAAWAAAGYGQVSADLMIAQPGGLSPEMSSTPALRLSLVPHDDATASRLAQRSWPLEAVERRYARFVVGYRSIAEWLLLAPAVSDLEALIVRISLIHDFRRVVLADPQLPSALLPQGWHGTPARLLCSETYRSVVGGAERWLDRYGENDAGVLPPPSAALARRFSD